MLKSRFVSYLRSRYDEVPAVKKFIDVKSYHAWERVMRFQLRLNIGWNEGSNSAMGFQEKGWRSAQWIFLWSYLFLWTLSLSSVRAYVRTCAKTCSHFAQFTPVRDFELSFESLNKLRGKSWGPNLRHSWDESWPWMTKPGPVELKVAKCLRQSHSKNPSLSIRPESTKRKQNAPFLVCTKHFLTFFLNIVAFSFGGICTYPEAAFQIKFNFFFKRSYFVTFEGSYNNDEQSEKCF